MNKLITHVSSLRRIRSTLPPNSHQRKPLRRSFKTEALQVFFFVGLPQSPSQETDKKSFSPAVCFKVAFCSLRRHSSCHLFSLYLALTFIYRHAFFFFLNFTFAFPSVCLTLPTPSHPPAPPSPLHTLASSCFYCCSGLQQRSLNHIRNGELLPHLIHKTEVELHYCQFYTFFFWTFFREGLVSTTPATLFTIFF